ncbi:glycosyltransferase [Candidatus Sumerlaeota bacterium]|nr:glycosyltransferase [Candidatus Sumerlaeota bacterium]
MPPQVIVVVPCYNEEKRLPVADYEDFVRGNSDYKFLLVNDGSRDGTLALLNSIAARNPEFFEVMNLEKNGGKAEAVRLGIQRAFAMGTEWVAFWDSDLATGLDELPYFLAITRERPGLQIVLGARVRLLGRDIHRKLPRHILGRVFATTASNYLRWPVYDTQCGAKFFRNTEVIREIYREPFISRWIFDVELLVRFKKACQRANLGTGSDKIYEYPLRRWEDVKGSTVKGRDFFKAFFEFFRIVMKYR